MKLNVYTIRRTIFTGETSRVTLPTIDGEVTLLEGHIPYVTVLAKGNLRYAHRIAHGSDTIEKEEIVPILGGFLEVRNDKEVRVLADE
jgi:F-type H+-transporting ATPase subunit epsilon